MTLTQSDHKALRPEVGFFLEYFRWNVWSGWGPLWTNKTNYLFKKKLYFYMNLRIWYCSWRSDSETHPFWWQITFLLFLPPPPPSFLCAGSSLLKLLSSIFPSFSSHSLLLLPFLPVSLFFSKGQKHTLTPLFAEAAPGTFSPSPHSSQNSSPAVRQACSYLCRLCGSMWAEAIDCGFGNGEEDRITAQFAWSSWWMHREPGLILYCFQCLFHLVWHHSYILYK